MVKLDATLKRLLAERDDAVALANATHSTRIEKLQVDLAEGQALLHEWADRNRAAEFGAKQSLDLPGGSLVYRLGARALEPANGAKWASVLKGLLGEGWKKLIAPLLTGPRAYVRVKAEVDKAKILRESAGDAPRLDALGLRRLGVKVIQEESFHVELGGPPAPALEVG